MFKVLDLDSERREREKQIARDRDAQMMRSGEISEYSIAARNDFFFSLDVENFHVAAIGNRRLQRRA